ncbi:hypothetical protein HOR73_gp044 [Escherichia phage phiLLS]|uniref:Uncharacterized protein n=1 Tax=Escherichia phage phiLLS TaxID=1965465 RepID=A0A1V0DZL3_9CAUD|nr:hypothetical protein HOR73_gp044 [Escherichia phage phiLLS]ARB06872.1 hypothetical protein lls_44 [Escherichia phage phiLLS]
MSKEIELEQALLSYSNYLQSDKETITKEQVLLILDSITSKFRTLEDYYSVGNGDEKVELRLNLLEDMGWDEEDQLGYLGISTEILENTEHENILEVKSKSAIRYNTYGTGITGIKALLSIDIGWLDE